MHRVFLPQWDMPARFAALAALAALIWGVNFVVIDSGLSGMPPLLFAAIRFTAVAIPAVFLVPRPAVHYRDVALVGLFMGVGQFAMLYTALHLGMPAGLASLVLQAQVLFSVVIAAAALGERPKRRQQIGVLLGMIGLAVVASRTSASVPTLAIVLTIGAALSWACGNVLSRRVRSSSGLSLTVWSATIVPVPLLALALLVNGPHAIVHALAHFGMRAALATAYTAYLSSLVGYGIWNTLLGRFPASTVTPFALLVPPVGVVTAWIVRGEVPRPAEIIGGLILIGGVAVCVLQSRTSGASTPQDGGTPLLTTDTVSSKSRAD